MKRGRIKGSKNYRIRNSIALIVTEHNWDNQLKDDEKCKEHKAKNKRRYASRISAGKSEWKKSVGSLKHKSRAAAKKMYL
jgi:hypothetical protein